MSDASPTPGRLASLDAYRGFVMLAMVSGGLGLPQVAKQFPESKVWNAIDYQLEHVAWTGCSAWDLIQPSFMFIVGVAVPFSLASRRSRGDSEAFILGHVLWRAIILVLLGIFLRSNGRDHTYYTFEDVSTQIGLGYLGVVLIAGRGWLAQVLAVAAILVGYWGLFALWPPPTEAQLAGIPDDWRQFTGFATHWNKHVNPAGYFDRWFLNLFPREEPFIVNNGGYQTLNFIPSMATMIFGVMTGEFLRSSRGNGVKVGWLIAAGLAALAIGLAVDETIWPMDQEYVTWSVAPIVKRIWTPSWAVFSTGWVLLTLAVFVLVMDVWKLRGWAFPLTVVGMNSIVMYVMSWLTKPWLKETLRTHLGDRVFAGTYGPLVESTIVLAILWLIVYAMYRHRVFIRI